jgi:hypothetical protein
MNDRVPTRWNLPPDNHSNAWYNNLARKLGHPGFVTLSEIRHEEWKESQDEASQNQ